MLDLEARHLAMLRTVLLRHVPDAHVWAYGSRVKGTAKKFSDVDIAIEAKAPLSLRVLALIDQDLSDSDLPVKVDVCDLRSVSPPFRERIERMRIPLF